MGSPQKAVIDLYNHSKDQEPPVSTPATLDSLVSKALSYLDEQVLSYFEVYTGKKPLFRHNRSIELIKALMEINGLEPLLSKILGLVNYNGATNNINDIAIYSFYQIYLMLKKSEIDCLDSEKKSTLAMVDALTFKLNNKHSNLLCADDLLKYDGKEPLDPENRFLILTLSMLLLDISSIKLTFC